MAKNKIPRQGTIPGMEDAGIEEIDSAAMEYIEGRDARMEATETEVTLKDALIAVMHKHGRNTYSRKIGAKRLTVNLVVEKESVKAKLQDDEKPHEEADVE